MADPLVSALESPFPAAAAYLRGLPAGVRSFPQCQMLADGPISLRALHPQVFSHPALPSELRQLMNAPWKPNDWVPYVLAVTMNELLREHLRMNEAAYQELAMQYALRFLDRPAYRSMCRVLSPHLLLMGINWRWNSFHRGLAMRDGGGEKRRHTRAIQYPPELLLPITLDYYGGIFKRVLQATGAQQVRVVKRPLGPGETAYDAQWQG